MAGSHSWSSAPVLKTGGRNWSVGSNPTPAALTRKSYKNPFERPIDKLVVKFVCGSERSGTHPH